jgi:hypothetical protein
MTKLSVKKFCHESLLEKNYCREPLLEKIYYHEREELLP